MPLIGNLFQSKSNRKERTELVLIIVPYIIETDSQAQAITQAIGDRLQLVDLPKPMLQGPAAAPELPAPPAPAPAAEARPGAAALTAPPAEADTDGDDDEPSRRASRRRRRNRRGAAL